MKGLVWKHVRIIALNVSAKVRLFQRHIHLKFVIKLQFSLHSVAIEAGLQQNYCELVRKIAGIFRGGQTNIARYRP